MVNGNGESRKVEYIDADGRYSLRLIPAGAPDSEAAAGVVLGPPPLNGLDLPLQTEIRLNNEFYHRGLITDEDIRRHRSEATSALAAALRADIDTLLASLRGEPVNA